MFGRIDYFDFAADQDRLYRHAIHLCSICLCHIGTYTFVIVCSFAHLPLTAAQFQFPSYWHRGAFRTYNDIRGTKRAGCSFSALLSYAHSPVACKKPRR